MGRAKRNPPFPCLSNNSKYGGNYVPSSNPQSDNIQSEINVNIQDIGRSQSSNFALKSQFCFSVTTIGLHMPHHWSFKIFILILVLGEGYAVYLFVKGCAIQEWPTANGVILSSDLAYVHMPRTSYDIKLTYEYSVDGVNYISNKLQPDLTRSSWRSEIENLIKTFPERSGVKVFYNPNDHSEAYLRSGLGYKIYLFIAFPWLWFGGIVFYCRVIKRDKAGNDPQSLE